ncbi:hypothetical protein [Yoonia litorea]|uniref:Adenylate kinase n=1 Tax=Yoonia litorea TaxID=1123755 RepID=A0A1I6MXE2_9RHOB|nr:hypothetical protein [Yoonia litorea]SFS20372.1 Adenylate kinase [Yoonia litorea]
MRIAILGNAGSGKSTLARKLAAEHNLPLHEVDKIMWTEDWKLVPEPQFNAAHEDMIASEGWVIDGMGFKGSFAPRLARATHVILCDFPLWQNFWLLAERQAKWQAGQTEDMPAGYKDPPETRALFQTVWSIDRNWMPFVRDEVTKVEGTATVKRITDFDDLRTFVLTA